MKRIAMNSKTFDQLGLIEPLLRAVRDEGYTTPTPIQEAAIPDLIAGRDLLGCAQTGTGKTAAFALPIIQRFTQQRKSAPPRGARALILTPTRELAAQISDSFKVYSRHLRLSRTVVFGGVGQVPQVRSLSRGVDVLVATPGRLLDLMGQGHVRLDSLEVFVLDEADRMLDMGFIHDVRRIIATLPKHRQSLFFSATMPSEIVRLADSMLSDPVKVEVDPQATTVEQVDQKVMFVSRGDKRDLLVHLLKDASVTRALVFTRTKHGADKVVRQLAHGRVQAEAIHGNKSQTNRTRALDNFRRGQTRVLVATDIAARGIDVESISHVVNFDLPNIPESYVHRIGRTARAGNDGIAVSFCDTEERPFLKDIERLIGLKVPVEESHPWHAPGIAAGMPAEKPASREQRRGARNGNGNGNGNENGSRRRRNLPRSGKPEQSDRRPGRPDTVVVSDSNQRPGNRPAAVSKGRSF
jgi:ATP-dependent RNA helicase RhlE